MNKDQLSQVLAYLDAEYAGIINRMTETEKKARAQHWATEVGMQDFDAVMIAVKKLARGQYMPRTAEVLSEVENSMKKRSEGNPKCRIFRDLSGQEILDLRYSDGSEWMSGYLGSFPLWMQIKFRWMSNPTPENTAAWDEFIYAHEGRDEYAQSGMFPECDALMAVIGGAA